MKPSFLLAAFAVAASVLAGGCASMVQVNRAATSAVETSSDIAQARLAGARALPPPSRLATVGDLPYVDTTSVDYAPAYPSAFDDPASLSAPAQSVGALMRSLSQLTGYRVVADDDLVNQRSSFATVAPAGPNDAAAPARPMPANSERAKIDAVAYRGTFKGLLDTIAGTLDAAWRFDAQSRTVSFYRYETRVFQIATVPGSAQSSTDVGTANDGVTGGQGQSIRVGASGARLNYETKLSVWSTLKDNITPMLSPGGTLAISEPTASITVRDRWDHVDQVAQYVEGMNRALTTQVRVNVTVYRVNRAKNDSRGFNWATLYNSLAQRANQFGLEINTPRPTDNGMSSLILTSPSENGNGSTVPFAGSQAFIDALSTVGDASVVTQGSVVTVNNVPAPFKVFQSKGYLAQTTSLLSGGGNNNSPIGAGATLTPGNVETGFSMTVLPSVQADGHRILLQVMLQLSSLDSLLSVESGGQSIQVPTVSGRQLMPRAWMRSGQSLVLAGFEDTQATRDVATPFGEHTWALGGNRKVGTSNTALVVVITPVATSHQTAI